MVQYTTWAPWDALEGTTGDAPMLLDTAKLVATIPPGSPNLRSIRAADGRSSGKYYWEYTADVLTNAGAPSWGYVGIRAAGSILLHDTMLAAISWYTGPPIHNTVWVGSAFTDVVIGTVANGQQFGVAVNFDAKLFWARSDNGQWNGSPTADPASGTGGISFATLNPGPYYPSFDGDQPGQQVTANFGQNAFNYAVPSGFVAGFPALGPPTGESSFWDRASAQHVTIEPSPRLTITGNNSSRPGGARAINGYKTGKYSIQATYVVLPSWPPQHGLIGFTTSDTTIGSENPAALYSDSGHVVVNGTDVVILSAYHNGDVIGMVIDLDAKRLWVQLNGGLWNNNSSADPAAGTLGIDVSAMFAPGRTYYPYMVSLAGAFPQYIADFSGWPLPVSLTLDNVLVTHQTPNVAGDQVFLSWSDDRGHSWSNPVGQPIGARGDYLASIQWQRLGLARDRVFRLTWSVPVATALQGAFVELDASAKS